MSLYNALRKQSEIRQSSRAYEENLYRQPTVEEQQSQTETQPIQQPQPEQSTWQKAGELSSARGMKIESHPKPFSPRGALAIRPMTTP